MPVHCYVEVCSAVASVEVLYPARLKRLHKEEHLPDWMPYCGRHARERITGWKSTARNIGAVQVPDTESDWNE